MKERSISTNESEYIYSILYQHHGDSFQHLFNKLMELLDDQFHPIKQKYDQSFQNI